MRNSSFALIALVVFAMSASTLAADNKAEAKKFQGEWRIISFVQGGENKAKGSSEKGTIKFDKDRFTIKNDGTFLNAGTWKIDASKEPMEFSYVYTEGAKPGSKEVGIYRWDDEDLVICLGDPRPTEFPSDANNKNTLIRLVKNKK